MNISRAKTLVVGVYLMQVGVCASAAMVTYNYDGTFIDDYNLEVQSFGTIAQGTPFSVSLSYDDAQDPTTSGYQADYTYSGLSLTIGNQVITSTNGLMSTSSKNLGAPSDLLLAYSSGRYTIGGFPNSSYYLALQNLNGGAFNTQSLAGVNLSLAEFTLGNSTFLALDNNTNPLLPIEFRGDLGASPVPLPGTLGLTGSALLGLLCLRRRKAKPLAMA